SASSPSDLAPNPPENPENQSQDPNAPKHPQLSVAYLLKNFPRPRFRRQRAAHSTEGKKTVNSKSRENADFFTRRQS
ncbi:MAG: hypothetical protein LBF51_05525, partial [Zoogloeaceae bacterium]|nr:hypothetical protein [Zoogloeaceae bacterium]